MVSDIRGSICHRLGSLRVLFVLECSASEVRSLTMKARATIEYELDWPSGLSLDELRQREAERWMTACEGLRTAVVKVDLSEEPGWWERPNA